MSDLESMGREIAAELVRVDRGPAVFPWPHYSIHTRRGPEDGLHDVTVWVFGSEPDEDFYEVRRELDDEPARLIEVIDREWGRYLDATRSPADWRAHLARVRAVFDDQGYVESLAAAESVDEVSRLLDDRAAICALFDWAAEHKVSGVHYGHFRERSHFTDEPERPSTGNGAQSFALAAALARLLDCSVLEVLERAAVTNVDELMAAMTAGKLDELMASLSGDAPLVAFLAARNLEGVA